MSRNASGTHTLPTGNPVVAGTAADPVAHNATMSDLSAEITDSLSRSGKGGMSAPLVITAGSATAPSIAPTGDTNTGIYAPAADELAITTGGTQRFKVSTTALTAGVPLAMGANKITGIADGTAAADAATFGQLSARSTDSVTPGTDWTAEGPGDGTFTSLTKTTSGVVQLNAVGTASVGAAAFSSIMTLPVGYRPANQVTTMGSVKAGGTEYVCRFAIGTNGVLAANAYDNGTALVAIPAIVNNDVIRLSVCFVAA